MIKVYVQILNLLYAPEVSDAAVFHIFRLLDDCATDVVHDCIFDLLYDYLGTNETTLISSVRAICKKQIRDYDRRHF